MEILLVRHGEPLVTISESGPADPALTERGHWQARCLGEWLAHEAIDHVVTSDKRRAIETALPLVERLRLGSEVVPDLAEIDRNAKVYAPPPLLARKFPDYLKAMQEGRFDEIGWDSFEVFQARVSKAWQDLLSRPRGERVVVACHGGTIGVILSEILGINSHAYLDSTPFASITRVEISEGSARLRSLHEISHFDGRRERAVGPVGEGFPEQ